MSDPLYQIRVYGDKEGDAELISGWWEAHGQGRLPVEILPPTGFFIESDGVEIGVGFLYLSIGIGVAFLEWAISKPGLSMQEMRGGFNVLVDFMKLHADSLDYGVIWSNTIPGIARMLKQHGFKSSGQRCATVFHRQYKEVQ